MNKRIVEIARSWIGTPFYHKGRSKKIGCDCIGLILGVMTELGVEIKKEFSYRKIISSNILVENLSKYLKEKDNISAGDIAVFYMNSYPSHIGIIGDYYNNSLSLIHSYAPLKKVVEHYLDEYWLGKLYKIYHFPEVESWHL